MRLILTCAMALCLAAATAPAGEPAFTAKPSAVKDGDPSTGSGQGKVKISFTVSAPTDVEVAVLGADGKVVRSLAAGVLGGKNPPPEPLKAGLAQSLEWDGKGDWGLPAGNGPYKVRVRAGMGVKFGRTVGDSPYNFNKTTCCGLAVDPKNGDLYFMAQRRINIPLEGYTDSVFLRVYDRTGKYLRELLPCPSSLDAASLKAFGSLQVPDADGHVPVNYSPYWPAFHPLGGDCKLAAFRAGENPAVLLLDENFRSLSLLRTDGGLPAGCSAVEPIHDKEAKLPERVRGTVMGAISADGRYAYFTGFCGAPAKGQQFDPKWPEGRIYRMELGKGKALRFADVPLPEKWPAPGEGYWGRRVESQALHGLAVDKAGRVFVCDQAAGKVRVFSPEGQEVGAAAVPDAWMCVPDDRTGALYVLTRRNAGRELFGKSLVRLDGWGPDAKVTDTLPMPVNNRSSHPSLAGDFGGEAPVLWVSGGAREESLLRIEYRGGKLVAGEDLADRGRTASGYAYRIAVDREADLVYVNDAKNVVLRYNGLTGEYAGKLKDGRPESIRASELCVRRDGMVYLVGGWRGAWIRLNRDLAPAPLADGRKEFSYLTSKMGVGHSDGTQGSCVTPDGRLYFNSMFWFRTNMILEVNPDGRPGRGSRLQDILAEHFARVEKQPPSEFTGLAKEGFKGALVGWLQDQSGGVEVDQQGNIYAGINVLPRGYALPGDLAKHKGGIGSVVKFGPGGGGMLPDPAKCKPGAAYQFYKNPSMTMPEKVGPGLAATSNDWWTGGGPGDKFLEGALRMYPLCAPFSSSGCACLTPRFDVDDYGRLYIPNAAACSVQVVDNEGNEIVKFGGYGNFDGPTPGPEAAKGQPAIPLAYPRAAKSSFRHIYVADDANRRVVRADPTWKAEETCEVK